MRLAGIDDTYHGFEIEDCFVSITILKCATIELTNEDDSSEFEQYLTRIGVKFEKDDIKTYTFYFKESIFLS